MVTISINGHDHDIPAPSTRHAPRFRTEENITSAAYAVAHLCHCGYQPSTVLRKIAEFYGLPAPAIVEEVEGRYHIRREVFGMTGGGVEGS